MDWTLALIAGICLVVGAVAVFYRPLRAFTNKVPVTGKYTYIALIAFGLAFGGIATVGGWWNMGIASVGGDGVGGDGVGLASACEIDYCRLATGGSAAAANVTFTEDTADPENYFVDSYNSTAVGGDLEMNGTLTCYLKEAPVTGSECNAIMYIVGPEYPSETDTSDAALYRLIDETSSPSEIEGVKYKQKVYLNDGSVASTSSDQELTAFNFAAGELKNTLGYAVEWDSAAHNRLKENTQKQILVKQKLPGADKTVYTFTLRKGLGD